MSFDVHIGQCSEKGPRRSNEDCCAVRAPESADDAHGWIAVIADGVSSGGAGREAAQTTALAVVRDYPGTPETWDTTVALDRLIGAQNAWLADHNRRRQGLPRVVASNQPPPSSGQPLAMTTLTALVLRGHAWTLAHVGDTRCWLLREGQLTQLTQDHALEDAMRRSRLTRAIGLDEGVRVDYLQGDLRVGDCFVLTSDGVHGPLSRARLAQLLSALAAASAPQSERGAQAAAEALVEAALRDGSRDNASAVVLQVLGLPAGRASDDGLADRDLAAPPMLRVGDRLDGYTVTATIADNGVHRLYQARDGEGGWSCSRRCIRREPVIRRSARCWRTRPGCRAVWRARPKAPRGTRPSSSRRSMRQAAAPAIASTPGMPGARWSSGWPLGVASRSRRSWTAHWPLHARWRACTGWASCIATSSRATCTWATTVAGGCSTSAWPPAAMSPRRCAACMRARRAT